MTNEIYAPNIHLFASHLQKAFLPDSPTVDLKQDILWEKCHAIFQEFGITQQLNLLPHLTDAPRADLLKGRLLSISAKTPQHKIPIKVNAYPVWIRDSYVLALNISYPQKEGQDSIEITQLPDFNPHQCLLPKFIDSNLGQTLLITAFLQSNERRQLRKLADSCVREVTQIPLNSPLNFNQESELFGSPIFEYGIPGKPSEYGNIIVWFFRSEQSSANFIDCYQQFTDIFFYYNKIIKSYQYSGEDYELGLQKCKQIEKNIAEFKHSLDDKIIEDEELKNLKRQIEELPQLALEYAQIMRNLEYYHTTIKINAENYAEKSRQIRNKVEGYYNIIPHEYFTFLETFTQRDCPYFKEQIKDNLSYLQHGSGLLDKAIATIRGIVEIEQARLDRQRQADEKERERQQQEREKNLQNELQAIGAGIAAGSFVAGSSGLLTTKDPISLELPFGLSQRPHPFIVSVLFSLVVGLLFYGVIKFLSTRGQKHSK